jgi:hypothetical protein
MFWVKKKLVVSAASVRVVVLGSQNATLRTDFRHHNHFIDAP